VSAVYALFENPQAAQAAVDRLRRSGVADPAITVISGEPFEAFEFSHRDRPTWIFRIAVAGGFAGLAFGAWLTRLTEVSWPLPTGGMPIVAWWPNIVIMFELTMLSAILCTVATLLVTARLPRKRPAFYDVAVSDGLILVGVENPTAPRDTLERALTVPGIQIKTLG
jgi:hypothetical protein